jgi:hypothetical protein
MADGWQTYPFEFRGGLISNLSPLQQGTQAPGSGRLMKNFEPSVDGGYMRIEGYDKYDNAFVPAYGEPRVQGSGQTGTTLIISNILFAPAVGSTFTIAGVTGTYTIANAGVSYNSTYKIATVTLTASLASSPADKAAITFTSHDGVVKGIAAWNSFVIASRNADIYRTTGTGFTKISKPHYGTVLVNGGSQTGTSLIMDGLIKAPQIGDTFSVAGIEKVYTVLAVPTVTSTSATVSINPALASSPADNAAITWLSADRFSNYKTRFSKYRLNSTEKIVGVDGTNYPFIYDGSTFKVLSDKTTDILGAQFVLSHKNQLFFAKNENIIFTAPYTDDDFNAATGSGIINVGGVITGIVVFRETLIVFTEKTISQLTGTTIQDFALQPITKNVGCVAADTIQEVGGDVMFLGPEGLRLLGATDRIGDFSLGVVSKPIQAEMTSLINGNSTFASCVIKQKSQYRIFGYNSNITASNSKGVLGTQMTGESSGGVAWAELVGFKCFVADSDYQDQTETIVFANNDGYVYKMEEGSSFDGTNIIASFATPYVPINDFRLRKTFYKLYLYTDPQGSVTTSVNLKLDFDDQGSVQPPTITLSNSAGSVGFYGNSGAKYGTTVYGDKLKKQFQTQVVGSGFSVSLQFVSDSQDPPFSLDAATLEYATHDRR